MRSSGLYVRYAERNFQVPSDLAEIKNALDLSRAEALEERERSVARTLEKLLKPMGAGPTRLEEIKRERARHSADSGAWIYKEPNFLAWASRERGPVLWISGKPGSGK
jgi:hypothetical protein